MSNGEKRHAEGRVENGMSSKHVTTERLEDKDTGPSSSKISKGEVTQEDNRSWVANYRRVIAILPGAGKSATLYNEVESSDDEGSDKSEGVLDTSSSSSGFDEGIPFPTKPKVIVKRTEIDQVPDH